MNPQHEQPRRPDAPKTPAWVREPEKPKVEFKHAPAVDDHQTHEEPGYGHGV
jgi:hypothetical protein